MSEGSTKAGRYVVGLFALSVGGVALYVLAMALFLALYAGVSSGLLAGLLAVAAGGAFVLWRIRRT